MQLLHVSMPMKDRIIPNKDSGLIVTIRWYRSQNLQSQLLVALIHLDNRGWKTKAHDRNLPSSVVPPVSVVVRLTIPDKIPKCLLTQFFQSFFELLAQWRLSCWICQVTKVCSWDWSWMKLNQPYYLNVILHKYFLRS